MSIQSIMSRTAIVAPKICACTLVSMMVVLIVGDVLQQCVCGEYNVLDSLEFRQVDPVEFGELVASRELNAEEGFRKILTHTGWELRPFSLKYKLCNPRGGVNWVINNLCNIIQAQY